MRTAIKETIKDIKIKMMVWGEPGSGKSLFALTAPKPLVIDLENSTGLYITKFDFLRAKVDQSKNGKDKDGKETGYRINNATNLTKQIISEIISGEYDGEVETLIIDPVTDLLDNFETILCTEYEKMIKKNVSQISALEKTKWYAYRRDGIRRMLDQIINLPLNIIFIARAKNLWDSKDGKMQPVGKTFDAIDILEYLPDVVINLTGNGQGYIKKSRLGKYPDMMEVNSWDSIINTIDTKNTKRTALKEVRKEKEAV